MQIKPISVRASAHLDMVRGIAAVAVMAGHLRTLFYVGYSQVVRKSVLAGAGYFLTSLGHQAVLVFFVLSGFFISRSVLGSFHETRWSWTIYLVNRLTRLLSVLVPGLLLCVFWDQWGMRLPSAQLFYYHDIPALGAGAVIAHSSPTVFLGNLLFLQSIYFPPFGSDMPLWSLSYEFWYYMLFPVLVLLFSPRLPFIKRFGFLLVGTAVVGLVGTPIMSLFLVWLAGAGIALIPAWRSKWTTIHFLGKYSYCGVIAAVILFIGTLWLTHGVASDFIVTVAFLPLMYAVVMARGSYVNPVYSRPARVLSSFSYSLYITHLPLLIFVRTCFGRVPRWQPDLRHTLYGATLLCGVATYSFGISRLTEARTDVMRQAVLHAIARINGQPLFAPKHSHDSTPAHQ